ncbi:MAG: transposase [Terriglobia bacterium]
MNNRDASLLSRFVHYGQKRFQLPLLAAGLTDRRVQPAIPAHPVVLSLILGEVVHIPSFLQLQEETREPAWQRWTGYHAPISHDTFGYVSERLDPEQLRRAARWINRQLKRGKAFEANKIKGLLCVSVDANEQFCSDHRCCEHCLVREISCKSAEGGEVKKTQYYHKQVYAQLSGPRLSVILDFEPMRQGEEECAAALRVLRRLRRQYGPRFFDVVVVDSWYAKGPFLKAVVEELGWAVIAVLKQERYEIHQEALALSRGKKPDQVVQREARRVEVWDVRSLRLSESYDAPVRVVRVRERWKQRQQRGDGWSHEEKEQNWLWVVAGDLEGYEGAVIRDIGHSRWKIENHAFGQLTQHWHLTHCSHHHPVAVVALLWIKIIAFTLFEAFAILCGKLVRSGKTTFQELRKQIYRSLFAGSPLRLFSG